MVVGDSDVTAVDDVAAALLRSVDSGETHRSAVRTVLELLEPHASHAAVALGLGDPDLLDLVAADGTGLDAREVARVDLSLLRPAERQSLRRGDTVVRPLLDVEQGSDVLIVLPLRCAQQCVGALLVAGPAGPLLARRSELESAAALIAHAVDGLRRRADSSRASEPAPLSSTALVEVTRGLERGQFRPWFQPSVDLRDGSIRGFEALVRWEHPERGVLLPLAFLDVVEQGGLLSTLDQDVMAQACGALMRLDADSDGPYVSVNLSPSQLLEAACSDRVEQVLVTSGLQPHRLVVEVTETSALANAKEAADVLTSLQALGVRIAFDDFGTGFSALSWLQDLPLDIVKVDRTFVARLPQPPEERQVVAAVVGLAHALRLDVVAEGVETPAQHEALLDMGVTVAQGWLFSKAVPEDEAAGLLRRAPWQPVTGSRRGADLACAR